MLTAGSLMLAASCSRGPACDAVTASATPPEPWLTVSLTETPAELRDRIERDWESRETTDGFAAFIVVRADDPLFPSDEDLATNADGHTDADLRRYRALPADRRTHDLYLVEPTGRRWPSEPHAGGPPLPFRTAFLLHLASAEGADAATAGAARTHVTAIEVGPTVLAGQDWRVHRHGAGWVDRVCRVAPTVGDRRRVLALVRALGTAAQP